MKLFYFLISIIVCISCCTQDVTDNYQMQLSNIRSHYKSFDAGAPHFFLFGMGNRDKYVYKDYQLIDIDNDSIIFHAKEAIFDSIIPSKYCVNIGTSEGVITIEEDESGIWINQGKDKKLVNSKECELKLPSFQNFKYGEILRVLHHELLINIKDSRIYPNILVYRKPFFRDAFMAALCLEKTGNTHLIESWLLEEKDVYDMQNGEAEVDNLGEMLYLLSFVPSDSNKILRDSLMAEIEKQTIRQGKFQYIQGHTDGSDNAEYQTQILKYAYKKNKLNDGYTMVPKNVAGYYYDLCWFTQGSNHSRSMERWYKDLHFNYKDSPYPYLQWARAHYFNNTNAAFNCQQYPLSWEKRGDKAHFDGMRIISNKAVEERICYPHTWTAAEMFLKLYEEQ